MSALSRVSLSVSAWRNQWSPSSVAPCTVPITCDRSRPTYSIASISPTSGHSTPGSSPMAQNAGQVPTPVGILARISNRACSQLSMPLVVSRAEVMSRYQPSAQLPDSLFAEITR